MISASGKSLGVAALTLLAIVASTSARADDVPTFTTDPASHCSIGTYHPDPRDSVRWNGTCAAGKAQGQGVAEWQTAGAFVARFEGTFEGGLIEGRGLKVTKDNRRFEAEFHQGKMSGRCVMTTPAVRVDGQCSNDAFNGRGIATFTNGNRYEGNFKDSAFNGQGHLFR